MTSVATTFEERFEDLARLAYRVAFRLLGSRPDAEDVAQEALARAAVRWPKIEAHAEAWTTRVTTNLALGQIRRRRPPLHPGSAQPCPDSGQESAHLEDRDALVAGLRALPRRQREVLALRYLGDLSEAQTAEALGCSVGSVKQHASRGLASLRRRLDLERDPPTDDPPGELHVRPAR